GDDIALLAALTDRNNRFLIDAGVLVGTFELHKLVNICRYFARQTTILLMVNTDNDALGVNAIDHTIAARNYYRATILRRNLLHTSADKWRFRAQQRHSLTLHVRTHQRAVRVVILQEGDERSGHGDELFRRYVDILDLIT